MVVTEKRARGKICPLSFTKTNFPMQCISSSCMGWVEKHSFAICNGTKEGENRIKECGFRTNRVPYKNEDGFWCLEASGYCGITNGRLGV